MRLRIVLPVLACALIGSAAPARATPNAPSRPPNIIMVMVDDQPAMDGRLLLAEPNVRDIFLDHGVSFTDFHAESPLCCPARAGFFTGQHTHNHGVVANDATLFNPAMTIATQLHAEGYYTFLSGKYLNQYGRVGSLGGMPPGWDHFFAVGDPEYYDYDVYDDGNPRPVHYGSSPSDYSADVFGQRFISQIRSAPRNQPIFGWYSPYPPHAPILPAPRHQNAACNVQMWSPPNYGERDVSDKPHYVQKAKPLRGGKARGIPLRDSCRSLLAVDDWVRQIRNVLADTGRLDNTIFVYSGDNGMNEGEHRLLDKQAPYETAIPFLISWPDGLGTSPRTVTERVQNIDFAPTMCELAGCRLGPYPNGQTRPDGISFADLLLGHASHLNRDAVLDEMPDVKDVGPSTPPPPPWYALTTTGSSPLARTGCSAAASAGCRWHYIEYDDGERELYDLSGGACWLWHEGMAGDPCELQNIVDRAAYAGLVRTLHDRLAQLEAEKGSSAG
jgi:N-acetylglucosamine-6-sulfatase